mgnify:CR=1 FL=1
MQLDEVKLKYGNGHLVIKSVGLAPEENAKALLAVMTRLGGNEEQEKPTQTEEPRKRNVLWTKAEVCEYLGYSVSWLNKRIKEKVFILPRVGGRNMKWDCEDVKRWVSHGKAA